MNDGARAFVQELAIETGVLVVVVVHLRGWVVWNVPHGNAVATRCGPCARTNTKNRADLIRVLGGEDAPLER
ncbi:MAG: hypothetical protein JWR00_2943 [Rubritepida sp.]|nr:hypothetical protein [Rubritepida sp.]